MKSITQSEVEHRIIEVLRSLGPGQYDELMQHVLVMRGDSSPDNRLTFAHALDELRRRGIVEGAGGMYRLADGYETAEADDHETAVKIRRPRNTFRRKYNRPEASA
jgi:hypothetical protein